MKRDRSSTQARKVLLELADLTHRPIPNASKVVEFTVPAPKPSH